MTCVENLYWIKLSVNLLCRVCNIECHHLHKFISVIHFHSPFTFDIQRQMIVNIGIIMMLIFSFACPIVLHYVSLSDVNVVKDTPVESCDEVTVLKSYWLCWLVFCVWYILLVLSQRAQEEGLVICVYRGGHNKKNNTYIRDRDAGESVNELTSSITTNSWI